jgi:hypothetical protein
MTQQKVTGVPAGQPISVALNLKAGGVCAIVGAVVFATVRIAHGDTPAADARAALEFVGSRHIYAVVHVVAVFSALAGLAALIALVSSFTRPPAWLLGRLAVVTATVGLAVFSVESTSEGLALPELADAYAKAAPDQQADLVRAAQAVAAGTHGPSLIALALLYGLSLILFGLAMALDAYPSWLGWAGVVVGAATLFAAVGLFLRPSLMPGSVVYGGLASVLDQLWLLVVGVVMVRRAARIPESA